MFSGLRINSSSESLRLGCIWSDEKDMKIGFNLRSKKEENNLNLNIKNCHLRQKYFI